MSDTTTLPTVQDELKLGRNQYVILHALREHSGWYEGCAWVWDGPRTTERLLDGLVRRGFATKTTRTLEHFGFTREVPSFEAVGPWRGREGARARRREVDAARQS